MHNFWDKNKKGFTIIELIVVIAVISVLASIILINVTGYINKSKEHAVKTEMSQVRQSAAIYFDAHGNYSNFCDSTNAGILFDSVSKFASITDWGCNNGTPHEKVCCRDKDITKWGACARLVIDETKAWCVDSTGNSRQISISDCNNAIDVCPQ